MANRQVCNVLARQARSFSSSSVQSSKQQVPIQLYGLEGRYATAIYTAASKKNQLDAVDKDFQDAVNELAVKRNANQLTINTLGLLAENGRLGRLRGIANNFATLMSAHRGEVNARVSTAKQLDNSQLKELQAVLQTFVKKGHSLKIETRVDPSLIGGLVVELGDRYVDLSISSKLKVYDQIVKETL